MNWIKAKDELPISEKTVILLSYGEVIFGYREIEDNLFRIEETLYWCYEKDNWIWGVTHWMPLPAPPIPQEEIEAQEKRDREHYKAIFEAINEN
jgi:hypothetical protein